MSLLDGVISRSRVIRLAICSGVLTVLGIGTCTSNAQDLSNAELLKPSADSWPQYHGDYSGKRHSSLTQINAQNVSRLSLAWAFQTNVPGPPIKSSPLLVDGMLYFTVPDHVWSVDARSGHMLWQ